MLTDAQVMCLAAKRPDIISMLAAHLGFVNCPANYRTFFEQWYLGFGVGLDGPIDETSAIDGVTRHARSLDDWAKVMGCPALASAPVATGVGSGLWFITGLAVGVGLLALAGSGGRRR